jgi:uncharacterized protein YecE (DUF72 family)
MDYIPGIRLGTSSFSGAGWVGSFYPKGTRPADFLSVYALYFETVELDTTFYRTPAASTVRGWADKTPANFIFAAKVPQLITHEKVLVDCDREFQEFVETMSLLGDKKLGPLLLQFPYFNKKAFATGADFAARLRPFLKKLPKGYKFSVEIRNKNWLDKAFLDVLREHGVALALIDHPWMPRPAELFEKLDPITADFTYIRWLGDRKGIEAITKVWNKTIVNRRAELQEWAKYCVPVMRKGVKVSAYANNHYAGYGPGTIELFVELLKSIVKS